MLQHRLRLYKSTKMTLIRVVLVMHCVLAFNHFMSSPVVLGGIDNFENLRLVSRTSCTYTKIEKKTIKTGFDFNPLTTSTHIYNSLNTENNVYGDRIDHAPAFPNLTLLASTQLLL